MTRNQLSNVLSAHTQGGSGAFYFPSAVLRLILALALTALEVAGVPQVSAPSSFATAADMAAFFRQLAPGNGYRLDLKAGLIKVLAYLVLRYARPQGQGGNTGGGSTGGGNTGGGSTGGGNTGGTGDGSTGYGRTLTVGGTSIADGVALAGTNGDTLEFDPVASQGGNPLTMYLRIGGAIVAQVDYDPVQDGKPFRFTYNGQPFTGTFNVNAPDLA